MTQLKYQFKIILYLLTIWAAGLSSGFTQEIKQTGLKVDRLQKKIYIQYQITDPSPLIYEYDIKLEYSQDAGITYKGPLTFLEGHFGPQIIAGSQKTIAWNYLQEDPDFYGMNVRFKILATYQKSVLNLKGMEGALYSMLVPGWGNAKVKFQKHKYTWLGVGLTSYGLLGTGLFLKAQSTQNYRAYQGAANFDEANPYYLTANKQLKWAKGLLLTGGLIWLGDVLQVAWRGLKNQRQKKRILIKNQPFGGAWN